MNSMSFPFATTSRANLRANASLRPLVIVGLAIGLAMRVVVRMARSPG